MRRMNSFLLLYHSVPFFYEGWGNKLKRFDCLGENWASQVSVMSLTIVILWREGVSRTLVSSFILSSLSSLSKVSLLFSYICIMSWGMRRRLLEKALCLRLRTNNKIHSHSIGVEEEEQGVVLCLVLSLTHFHSRQRERKYIGVISRFSFVPPGIIRFESPWSRERWIMPTVKILLRI
jgi:hypothetical protein